MIEELRQSCRKLLEDGTVNVVIAYGQSDPEGPVYPIFVTKPEDADKIVWNRQCYANLTTYLTRKEVKALGKSAILVKGCDARSLVVLEQESQVDRANVYVIGLACDGVGEPDLAGKCRVCEVHMPHATDLTVGTAAEEQHDSQERYAAVEEFMKKSPEERMAFWKQEFERCVRCYACRGVCPLCYCNQCIVDKNRPVVIDTSASLKGNFAWNITRAFHLAGRCVGCGECTRVCPAGIDLRLLNASLARSAEENFNYRAGMDPETPPVIGTYNAEDKENFIQ